jgi:hypothetical protein
MPQIELVMEVDGCFTERADNNLMQGECRSNNNRGEFLESWLEFLEVTHKECTVYEEERLIVRERN